MGGSLDLKRYLYIVLIIYKINYIHYLLIHDISSSSKGFSKVVCSGSIKTTAEVTVNPCE